ncbi:MAG: saccharopine dehydrogenase [Myxococcaceae bacterium]|nr:saccharopine dehydrogenase [Myxococcaceae bacterium]
MNSSWMIYGANGYTGTLIAELAVARGDRPILAGRTRGALAPLAHRLGRELRVFELDDAGEIERARRDVALVLHCAGPYQDTAAPIVDACLATRTHYLDLTGEVDVLEEIFRLHEQAQSAGIVATARSSRRARRATVAKCRFAADLPTSRPCRGQMCRRQGGPPTSATSRSTPPCPACSLGPW